ncbi:MAG: glycosyltransferase [Alphaproteobacteria bacterium GM202ARS2]|nr:glycosyltransferase [Alphaproteobacteria bacterium GM202ARS2]
MMRVLHVIEERLAFRHRRLLLHVLGGLAGLGVKQYALGFGSVRLLDMLHRRGVDARLDVMDSETTGVLSRSQRRMTRDIDDFIGAYGLSHVLAWGRGARSVVARREHKAVMRVGIVFDYTHRPEAGMFDAVFTFREMLRDSLQEDKGWQSQRLFCVPFLVDRVTEVGQINRARDYAIPARARVLLVRAQNAPQGLWQEELDRLFSALKMQQNWYVWLFHSGEGQTKAIAERSVAYGIRPRLRILKGEANYAEHVKACDALALLDEMDAFDEPLLEAWACRKVVLLARPRYLDRRLLPQGNVFVTDSSMHAWAHVLQKVEEQDTSVDAVAQAGYRAYLDQFTPARALQKWYDTLQGLDKVVDSL